MGWNNKQVKQQTNIVSLRMDAAFFFEKALQSLDRFHYERALKYFRKAAELEPLSVINHCNLAGILSEVGSYEESNEVLQHILDEIDPLMTECYFYMANNYANMEQFELSEQSLIDYLAHDDELHFLEECKEMMEWLSYELKRPIDIDEIVPQSDEASHQQAQKLLEQGLFLEASQLLEKLVKNDSDFIAAYNNLALAYYCLGDYERSRQAIDIVLNKEPGNLHALCNLSIYYLQQNKHAELKPLIEVLTRLYPFYPEHNYKLAMTFAMLGEHEAAYLRFKKLLKTEEFADASTFHYTAVAASHIGKPEEAIRLWKQVSRLDPESQVAAFYLSRLEQFGRDVSWEEWELSYHYYPPIDYHFHLLDESQIEYADLVRNDPLLRSSFFWALHHGEDTVKQQIIEVLSLIGGKQVESVLRHYLLKDGESAEIKNLAIFALRMMGAEEPFQAVINNKEIVVYSLPPNAKLPTWEAHWEEVTELAIKNMKERGYDIIQLRDLQTLWVEYLSKVYPDTPNIVKCEGWAAALEYLIAKMHRKPVTYRVLAAQYHISESTIQKNVKRIDEACGLQEKMEATTSFKLNQFHHSKKRL